MTPYSEIYKVLGSDIDIQYRMTPNAVLHYFQDCFARLVSSRHLAAFDIIKQDLIWLITEFDLNCTGERPLWSENIRVEISFSKITPIRMYADFRIYDCHDRIFAEGCSVWVVIHAATKRPFASKEMLENAGITESGEPFKGIAPQVKAEKIAVKSVNHTVNISDLDFNGHVCNRSYLRFAMNTAPLEFLNQNKPERIHVKFVREAFLNEVLTCNVSKYDTEQDIFSHEITGEDGKTVCNIYTEWADDTQAVAKDISEALIR